MAGTKHAPKRNIAIEGLDYEKELAVIGSLANRLAIAGFMAEKDKLVTIHAALKAKASAKK